jgi:hypothetical protein
MNLKEEIIEHFKEYTLLEKHIFGIEDFTFGLQLVYDLIPGCELRYLVSLAVKYDYLYHVTTRISLPEKVVFDFYKPSI